MRVLVKVLGSVTVTVMLRVIVIRPVLVMIGVEEVELLDGVIGEPSVEEVLPPVGAVAGGKVALWLPVGLDEMPVEHGRLQVLLVPVTGAIGVVLEADPVPVRELPEIGKGGNG